MNGKEATAIEPKQQELTFEDQLIEEYLKQCEEDERAQMEKLEQQSKKSKAAVSRGSMKP